MSSSATLEDSGLVESLYNTGDASLIAQKVFDANSVSSLLDENNWNGGFLFVFMYKFVGDIMHLFETMSLDQLVFEFQKIWGTLLIQEIELFSKYSPRTNYIKQLKVTFERNFSKTKTIQNAKGEDMIVRDIEHIKNYHQKLLDCAAVVFKAHEHLIKKKDSSFWSSTLNPSVKWFAKKNFETAASTSTTTEQIQAPTSIEDVWFNIVEISKLQKTDKADEMIWSQLMYLVSLTFVLNRISEKNRNKALISLQQFLKDIRERIEQKKAIDFSEMIPSHLQNACQDSNPEEKKELMCAFIELFKTLFKPMFHGFMKVWDYCPKPLQLKIEEIIQTKTGKPRFSFALVCQQFDSCFDRMTELIETVSIEDILSQSEKISNLFWSNRHLFTPDCLKDDTDEE